MKISNPLRFHWSLSQAGDKLRRSGAHEKLSGVPPYDAQLALCRCAEKNGIDSVLMAVGFTRPDPMMLALTLGMETSSLKFMVACRPGLQSPLELVHQVNTISQLIDGRIHLNVVSGHSQRELRFYGDFLDHDRRYERAAEFLTVCRNLWQGLQPLDFSGRYYRFEGAVVPNTFTCPERTAPRLYLGGNSTQAVDLVINHGDCLWRFPDCPDSVRAGIMPILAAGKRAGLLVSLIARSTRRAARSAAEELIAGLDDRALEAHKSFARRTDSVGFSSMYRRAVDEDTWLTDVLWIGAVPYLGPPAIAFVGSYEDIAETLMSYKKLGISELLFMGWPEIEELKVFGCEVLPRVRELEQIGTAAPSGGTL